MEFSQDIENYLNKNFENVEHIKSSFSELSEKEQIDKIIRCVLYLSENNSDTVDFWITRCKKDPNEVINFAENSKSSKIKLDFSKPLNTLTTYSKSKIY